MSFDQSNSLSLFHQAMIAHELVLKYPAHEHRKLTRSLSKATVDLNPHQIDAALFAFQSPLSRGALLADEVGLGKTIEAGLVISQLFAEKIESQKYELRRQLERTQDYKERLELRKKLDGLEKAYYRKVTQIEKERRKLFRQKDKRIRDLDQRSQLRISEKLVGMCHWRLV